MPVSAVRSGAVSLCSFFSLLAGGVFSDRLPASSLRRQARKGRTPAWAVRGQRDAKEKAARGGDRSYSAGKELGGGVGAVTNPRLFRRPIRPSDTRAVVMFAPLTLENGMTEIKLVYQSWVPDGTSMMWEIRPSGTQEWKQIKPETPDNPNPLRGLPALCELRLTMIGTNGLAPALLLNNRARGLTRRPRSDAKAISKILQFGVNTTNIMAELTMDARDDALHTVAPKLMIGTTTYLPSTVTIAKDVNKEQRRTVTATFAVPSTNNARLVADLTTTSVQSVPFIENASLFAL